MSKCLYINPWRRTKDGRPVYQKSEPKLKSAFADRRKKRVHSRAEFRAYVPHRRNAFCVLAVGSGRGNPWPYTVSGRGLGLPVGASTLPQAMCVFANATNYCAVNYCASVQGATWRDGGVV